MKNVSKIRRKIRTRAKVKGTGSKPRLSIFRSNKFIYAQVIDDGKMQTLLGLSENDLPKKEKISKSERAKELGLLIAKKALDKKIKEVVFDRGSYQYHGRVKQVAEGAREGGLKF
jgi:large subunit ribosomal protein L18